MYEIPLINFCKSLFSIEDKTARLRSRGSETMKFIMMKAEDCETLTPTFHQLPRQGAFLLKATNTFFR